LLSKRIGLITRKQSPSSTSNEKKKGGITDPAVISCGGKRGGVAGQTKGRRPASRQTNQKTTFTNPTRHAKREREPSSKKKRKGRENLLKDCRARGERGRRSHLRHLPKGGTCNILSTTYSTEERERRGGEKRSMRGRVGKRSDRKSLLMAGKGGEG